MHMLDPDGNKTPLYVSDNGYLWLRVFPVTHSEVTKEIRHVKALRKPSTEASPRTIQVGWVSNDRALWHHRLCHQNDEVVSGTANHCAGIPDLKRYISKSGNASNSCISCALGKSCESHIGPTQWSNLEKQHKEKDKLSGTDHPSRSKDYLPMQQLQLDCAEMDAPDFYGNTWFLMIVDRSTGFRWVLPLKDLSELYKVVDEFLDKVAEPYLREHGEERRHVHTIRTDSGSEFINEAFESMRRKRGVKTHSIASANVKDGKVERSIQTVCWLTRTCLIEAAWL